MANITSGLTITPVHPEMDFRTVAVETAATADGGDTFTITMATYGCTTFLGLLEWIHTTEGSVIVPGENAGGTASTTSVSSGVITVTLSGVTSNQKRVFLFYMK